MSTKIYDGKRLPDMSVLELHQFCQKLKADLLPIVKTQYCKLIAEIAQAAYLYSLTGQNVCKYHVDMTELGKPSTEFSAEEIFFFAKEQANKLVLSTSAAVRRIDSEDDADFDVTICVFPIVDKTLCIPYANNDALHEILFNVEEFIEYGYWNNTDHPTNVSDCEWAQRKIDWDKALPGIGIPRESGMVFKIIDAPYDVVQKMWITLDDVIPYFKADRELCEQFAKNAILEREFQKYVEELGGDWIQNGYKCLRRAQAYIESHADEVTGKSSELIATVKCVEFFSSKNE